MAVPRLALLCAWRLLREAAAVRTASRRTDSEELLTIPVPSCRHGLTCFVRGEGDRTVESCPPEGHECGSSRCRCYQPCMNATREDAQGNCVCERNEECYDPNRRTDNNGTCLFAFYGILFPSNRGYHRSTYPPDGLGPYCRQIEGQEQEDQEGHHHGHRHGHRHSHGRSQARNEGLAQAIPVLPGLTDHEFERVQSAVEATSSQLPPAVVAAVTQGIQCSITHEVMRDPVVCADGNTYDRAAIQRWFQTRQTSPVTGAVLPHTNLVRNQAVWAILQGFLDDSASTTKKSL